MAIQNSYIKYVLFRLIELTCYHLFPLGMMYDMFVWLQWAKNVQVAYELILPGNVE